MADIAERLDAVRQRIVRAGADPGAVQIVGVTKGHPIGVVHAGIAAGLTAIGESYAQEINAKFAAPLAIAELHLIGHLQTNKVRLVAGLVDLVSSVDRRSVVAELAKRMPGVRVLVQVNTTGEPAKSGCSPAEAEGLVAAAGAAGLRVEGLMTIGPTDGDAARTRQAFVELRRLVDRLGLTTCSMGMSDDLEIAVAEGSTQVRVGTALFGVRPPKALLG